MHKEIATVARAACHRLWQRSAVVAALPTWPLQQRQQPQHRFTTSTAAAAAASGVSALEEGRKVVLQGDDSCSHTFHARWLLHNCPSMKQSGTGQRLVEIQDMEADPRVVRSERIADDDTGQAMVELQWAHGHVSKFSESWLLDNSYSSAALKRHAAARVPDILAPEDPIPRVDYAEIESSEEGVWRWLTHVNRFGVCLVSNVPYDDADSSNADGLCAVAQRIAQLQRNIYGDVFAVQVEPEAINVAYTTAGLGAHMDLVYYESPPGLQLLHCTRFDEEVQGGASTFLDCFEMAELFRQRQPKHFETLCRVPATLQKIHTKRAVPVHIVYQRPHIDVNSRGEIVALHWSPPFEGPLRVPEEDVEPYYDAYVAFCNLMREETPKRGKRHLLRPGDLLCFNNRRVLHGRDGFTQPSSDTPSRVLQGCYINIDEFISRFNVLCAQFGGLDNVKRVMNGDDQ